MWTLVMASSASAAATSRVAMAEAASAISAPRVVTSVTSVAKIASFKALALELAIFATLVTEVTTRGAEIALAASAMATLDVAAALAELAITNVHIRPVVDNSTQFLVKGGRHPVVEAALK